MFECCTVVRGDDGIALTSQKLEIGMIIGGCAVATSESPTKGEKHHGVFLLGCVRADIPIQSEGV